MRHADHSCAYTVYTPPPPTSITLSLQFVCFFFFPSNNHAQSSTTQFYTLLHCPITTHSLLLSHRCRFLDLQPFVAASGAAIQDCETCMKGLPPLIDGSNQNKQSVSKIPPCCVETLKPLFLTFSIAAFLYSSHLRCLVIYSTFIWALCVFGMYTENPSPPPTANIKAQGKKEKKKQRGEAAVEKTLRFLTHPLLCKFLKTFLRGKQNCHIIFYMEWEKVRQNQSHVV